MRTFKAGDTVKHAPTGETWLLIRDEQHGKVFPGGWPATMANASDCTLVSPIEDAPDRLRSVFDDAAFERWENSQQPGERGRI